MEQLLDVRIDSVAFLAGLYLISSIALVALSTLLLLRHEPVGASRRPPIRRWARLLIAPAVGAVTGWLLAWLVGDVVDVFGVSPSLPTRIWIASFFAGTALAGTGLVSLRGWRRAVAVITLPLVLSSGLAGVNADTGQFPTLRAALGLPVYGPLDATAPAIASATASATLTAHGQVGTVSIPATTSGFAARPGMVYLPPVALQAHPPVLPVIEAFSGQPGSPSDLFTSGELATILDRWAAAHGGVAPIVVVPDQLGAPERNPMCVDSALGRSASYLTVDVPNWIRAHFAVAASPHGWAIAGFSQGGTCSIQLGAAHPELYGTVFDIAGELVPRAGSTGSTVRAAFGGSTAKYAAAAPTAILAAHAPYSSLTTIFAAGANDARYRAWAHTLADAAALAGATTRVIESPGTAHDWHTVRFAWTTALPALTEALGLPLRRSTGSRR
jgi:enterochelin esterase-like enzyme